MLTTEPQSNKRHILEILEHNASTKDWTDAITHCIDNGNISISYSQLVQRSKRWSNGLSSVVSKGDRVLIIMSSGLDFYAAFCACLYLGAIAVPLPRPRGIEGAESLQKIIIDAKPKAIISNYDVSGFTNIINSGLKIFSIEELDSENEEIKVDFLDPEAILILQYTSGSTGAPKAVIINNNNVLSNSIAIGRAFEHTSESRGLVWLPHYHDMGLIGGIIHPFVEGFRTNILCPIKFMQKPIRWLRAISELKINTSGGPNFAYAECIKRISDDEIAGLDLSSWDLAFVGAEPVRDEILNKFANRFSSIGFNKSAFFPCYGLAEATLMVTGGPKGNALNVKKFNDKTFVDSGPPVDGCKVSIVNHANHDVLVDGQEGEIWINGPNVAQGYWNNEKASQEYFNATLPNDDTPYLRTGDSGYISNGRLTICGRIKDLIIIRGVNYHPEDIERTCSESLPELWSLAKVAISVVINDEVKLVIVQEADPKLDLEKLKKKAKQSIFQIYGLSLHDFVFVKQRSLPKTSSGKVKRGQTQKLYLNSELTHLDLQL